MSKTDIENKNGVVNKPETKSEFEIPAALTLEYSKQKFGAKKGVQVYHEVARAGGFGDFENVTSTGDYFPALSLTGLSIEQREAVETVLADATKQPA